MALDPVINFGKVTVSTGYDDVATSIVLSSGDGAKLPSTFSYNMTWWNNTDYADPADDPNVEIVRVSGRSTDTLSPIARAQEGTTATVKNLAGKTYKMILSVTKKMIDDIGGYFDGTNSFTELKIDPTTSSSTGIIFKGTDRFIHNFQHPTGGGAIPNGKNIFIGIGAGNFTMGSTATITTHSSRNIGIGADSLLNNTTGSSNAAMGNDTLKVNTTGANNMAIGTSALTANTTGSANVGIGGSALASNTKGVNNVAIGNSALTLITGTFISHNTAIGTSSLLALTTGITNTAMGYTSGRFIADGTTPNETSSECVFIGGYTKASADGVSRETVIGYDAIGKGTDTAIIGAEGVNTKVYASGGLIVNQVDASGAMPALLLNQDDVSEEMIEFDSTVGVGNAIEAVGAKVLTTTHFIKVTITGVGTRYIPCGTIA